MRYLILFLLLPCALYAQPFQFELQPDAFPVYIGGVPIQQPWTGGYDAVTPTFWDSDNDGDLDLFMGDSRGYIDYFENIGASTNPEFKWITNFYDSLLCYRATPNPTWGWSKIRFSDLNGDGLKDIILGAVFYNQLILYHNIGTLVQPVFTNIADTIRDNNGNIIYGQYCTFADIDADGLLDLFIATGGYLKYYHNIGTSSIPVFELISTNWFNTYVSANFNDPCFGDLDGDGDLDLLIGDGDGFISYYRNDGTPQVPQMTLVTNNYLNIDVQKYSSPELVDIDGDGDLDLFIGRSSSENQSPAQGSLFFYRNDGTAQIPNFHYVTSNYIAWDCGYGSSPRFMDFNNDSLPDLVSRAGSHLILYRNIGTFGNPIFSYQTTNLGNIAVVDLVPWFVDINGDGLLDLFAGTSAIPGPPGLKLFINEGTPQTPNWTLYTNNLIPGVFNTNSVILCPWTGDIDNDGDQDLFVTDDNGCCYFFRNIGSMTHFQFQFVTNNWQNLETPNMPSFRYGCFYDVDGDGDLDLFINSDTVYWLPFEKNLLFYRNTGTPQIANMVLESRDLFPDHMIWQSAPYMVDIDGDGDGDLFVGDTYGGIRFFRNVTGDSIGVVGPPQERPHPKRATLTINPSPANPKTAISIQLTAFSFVNLSVYDLLGRKIAELVNGSLSAGEHLVSWDASGNASGVYLVKLEAGGSEAMPTIVTGKVVVVR
jgi:hypothetical protein